LAFRDSVKCAFIVFFKNNTTSIIQFCYRKENQMEETKLIEAFSINSKVEAYNMQAKFIGSVKHR
jgi:hypothetical protein